MIVVPVLVLLKMPWATAEDDLKGAENMVCVLALDLFMHSAKALAAAALMLHGQNFETRFEIARNFELHLVPGSLLWSDFLRTYCTCLER